MGRKGRRGLWIIPLAVLIVSAVWLGVWAFAPRDDATKGELEKLRALGVPTTPDELRASLPNPKPNGAALLKAAREKHSKTPVEDRRALEEIYRSVLMGTATNEQLAQAEGILRRSPILAEIDIATQATGANWDRRWERALHLPLDDYNYLRPAVSAASLDLRLAIRDRDVARVVKRMKQLDRLAHFTMQDPTMIGSLMATRYRAVLDTLTRAAVAEFARAPNALGELGGAVLSYDELLPPKHSLSSEVVVIPQLFDEIAALAGVALQDVGAEAVRSKSLPAKRDVMHAIPAVRQEAESKVLGAWRRLHDVSQSNGGGWQAYASAFEVVAHDMRLDQSAAGSLAHEIWYDSSQTMMTLPRPVA